MISLSTLPRPALALFLLLPALLGLSGRDVLTRTARAAAPAGELPGIYADFETERGKITVELFYEKAPLTVMNFIGLAEGALPTTEGAPTGRPFFDGLTFHRVVADFVIQGGDPRADGEGGPGYSFPDEFVPGLGHNRAGVLSMANDGPDTNGSQFFITLKPVERLNYLHSVFGQVVAGEDVPGRIVAGDVIQRVVIRRIGPAAEKFRAGREAFEARREATLRARRTVADGAGFTYFKDGAKALEAFRVKNFNFKLANYERTTGRRIAVRLLEGSFSDYQARNVTKTLAEELGLRDAGDGVMACLFTGAGLWKLRLGEGTLPALLGPGVSGEGELAKPRARVLHEGKIALAAPAQALLGEGKPKESCDALIDGLIRRLDEFALGGGKP